MKKILALLLTVAMCLSLFACSEEAVEIDPDDLYTTYYKSIIDTGRYYIKYTTEYKYEGKSYDFKVKYGIQNGGVTCVSEYGNNKMVAMVLDGKYYQIKDEEQTIYTYDEEFEIPGFVELDLEDIKATAIGHKRFNGDSCYYETYKSDNGNMTFYYDEGDSTIIGIDMIYLGQNVTLDIEEFKSSVSAGSLPDFPANYNEVKASEVTSSDNSASSNTSSTSSKSSDEDAYMDYDEFFASSNEIVTTGE